MNENEKLEKTSDEAKKFAEILQESKREGNLYNFASVAVKSYLDGMKAALNCRQVAQAT